MWSLPEAMHFRFPDFNSAGSIQVECVFVKFLDYGINWLSFNVLQPVSTPRCDSGHFLSPKQTPYLPRHLIVYGLDTVELNQAVPKLLFLRFRGRIVPTAANRGLLH